MRKENKTRSAREIVTMRSQRYHETRNYDVDYAYQGFDKNKYFTSDRAKLLNDNFEVIGNEDFALKGFGLEIELECDSINENQILNDVLHQMVFKHLPIDLFKFQRDGSLRGLSNTEAITQVMTKEFIRNNYPERKYAWEMMEHLKIGTQLSGRRNCGMHCNVSNGYFGANKKTQETNIRKLAYFINHNYDLCCGLFTRDRSTTYYCERMRDFIDKDRAQKVDLERFESDHSVSFNLGHYTEGRIEIRLVGGQKNYASFRNTLETIFHLIDALKDISWKDIDDLTKVFDGCNRYVLSRLSLCVENRLLDRSTYETIEANYDDSVDFGNF